MPGTWSRVDARSVSDEGGESACWLDLVDDEGQIATTSDAVTDARNVGVDALAVRLVRRAGMRRPSRAAVLAGSARLGARRAVAGTSRSSGVCARRVATCTPTCSASTVRSRSTSTSVSTTSRPQRLAWWRSARRRSPDFDIWRVMRSPGGLAFCLVPGGGENVPAPAGVAGRPPQPARAAVRRLAAPTSTRRRSRSGGRHRLAIRAVERCAEYGGKLFPPSPAPVRLLFQRLGDDDARHVDPSAHRSRDRRHRRPRSHGSRRSARTRSAYEGDGWVQLTDPSGMPFCVTRIPPD